ncbi:MAG: spore cortex biosynthesis protein YabQ [Clostridia bacterium]|nr:spore cortex biosynthesis protein YabQ [Clostridia bacterium]
MVASMSSLANMTLLAFFLGIVFGILYDAVRISRAFIGHSYGGRSAAYLYEREYPLIGKLEKKTGKFKTGFLTAMVIFGDIIYFTVCGLIFTVFIYYTNDGTFRFQSLLAVIVGFFSYYLTFGRLVIACAEIICIFLKIIIKIFLFSIAFPFKIMYNILIKLYNWLFGIVFAPLLCKIHRKSTERKMKKLLNDASNGFLQNFMKGQDA